jgi:hypothetical protein
MEKKDNTGLQGTQKVQGVWERRTQERRWGQNQLFGSFKVDSGVPALNHDDPTDSALAAIASILDKPADRPTTRSVEKTETPLPDVAVVAPEPPPPHPPPSPATDIDQYVKLGPGPLDAIRFKWSARPAGGGTYFVDETIGESSRKITLGPMPKEEAIRVIDERESDARRRYEALRNEMTGRELSTSNSQQDDGRKG